MRNLKRVLSLALASVMVVSMMVIGAGAANFDDFSDKDKIVNKEAVSVLVELGVLSGKDNGSYDPTGIITRGEMAKIICVVLNKGQDPNLGAVNSNTYTDTIGHWAAPYIEYCTTLGIVAGKGDGTFAPNDTVTASEASKMLLVALGYNAQYESMIGANWAVATNVLANKNGLYDGLTLDVSAGLTRDNAAQMMYNALDAKVVAYDYSVIPNGDSVSAIATAKETGKTLLEDKFGAVKVTGVVIRNEIGSVNGTNPLDEGETYIDVTNYGANEEQFKLDDGKYNVSTSKDLLGKSVSIYVKPGNSSVTTSATVLGGAMEGENTVVTLTSGDAKKDIEQRLSDEDMDIDPSASFVTNYTETGLFNKTHKTVNGVAIVAIDNDDDGVAEYVLQNFEVFGKVTSYSTKDDGSISVAASSVVANYGFWDSTAPGRYTKAAVKMDDSSDVIGFEDVEKDSYVFAQEIGGKLYIRVAEPVEMIPTAKQGDDFKADGETYEKAGTVNKVDESNTVLSAAVEIGEAANVYMDKFGYVTYVSDVDTTLKYLYVINSVGDAVHGATAKVVFADGSTDTIEVSKLNGTDTTSALRSGVYSYTVSGSKYRVYNTASKFKVGQINAVDQTSQADYIKKGNADLTIGGSHSGAVNSADSNTVFVIQNGSSWEIYTGINNVPTLKSVQDSGDSKYDFSAYMAGKNTYADVVFVTLSNRSSVTEVANSIYVLNKDAYMEKDANGDDVYTYSVIYKGEKVDMKADSDFALADTGLYVSPAISGGDTIDSLTAGMRQTPAEVTKAEAGVIEVATPLLSQSRYTVAEGTTRYFAIDGKNVTEVSFSYITQRVLGSVAGDMINIIPDKDNATLASYVFILE